MAQTSGSGLERVTPGQVLAARSYGGSVGLGLALAGRGAGMLRAGREPAILQAERR